MKNASLFLILVISSFFVSCSSSGESNSYQSNEGLEIIKVDLSEAREGKLSEFFEPEIEYIWLKDDTEEGLIGRDIQSIFFHDDKIFVMDTYGCKCIQIFDMTGEFINKIRAYGEGPGQYLKFDDAIIRKDEIMLVGVFPRKFMWFSLEGKFLREQKVEEKFGAGVYSDREKRYYFYSNATAQGEFFVESVNEAFEDTLRSIPFVEDTFYGYYSDASNLHEEEENIYFGMPYQDTIYEASSSQLTAKYVWDFGNYGQDVKQLQKYNVEENPMDYIKFINTEAKMFFGPQWFISKKLLISSFKYERDSYSMFYNRETRQPNLIKKLLINDLDEALKYANLFHDFTQGKFGSAFPGKTLYNELQKKKVELGQKGFDEYVKGKGKSFAQAAFAAKDSENLVLIVYTVKE